MQRLRRLTMTKRKTPATTRAKKPKTTAVRKQAESGPRSTRPSREPQTKTAALLALLARTQGASLEELQSRSGWQPHSVRGFLAGTVKKMPGVGLTSEKPGQGSTPLSRSAGLGLRR
jgi:hypothetical protein